MPLLAVRGLTVAFPTRSGLTVAVHDVSFEVPKGSCLGLVGESGCGKSVTLRALVGLVPRPGRTLSGEVRWDGTNLLAVRPAEIERVRGTDISMIFQDATVSLNPVLSVGEQISEVLRVKQGAGRRAARAETVRLLDRVGIPSPGRRADSYPHELSGGMCQRVMIAIAIAGRPRLLLADEPTTALDVTIQDQILSLLDELRVETGMAVILVSHDLGVVAERADRIAVMYAGRLLEEGPASDVIRAPRHPYTQGLIAAIPSLDPRGRDRPLAAIGGHPPVRLDARDGCPFAPRCPHVRDGCDAVPMRLDRSSGGHGSACPFVDAAAGGASTSLTGHESGRPGSPPAGRPDRGEPILEVRDLVKSFAGRRTVLERVTRKPGSALFALDGVSMELHRNEVLGLVGESGSGKTTLARCLVRMVRADGGRIVAFDTDVLACSHDELRRLRRRVQLVYQDPYSSLNPRMSIGSAIGEAARVHGLVTRTTERSRVLELLDLVGLPAGAVALAPRELSGGERQRAAIARALAVEPEVLVADEAVSALDVSVQAQVLNLFADLRRDLGLSMVFISHQLSVIAHVADRVAVMYLGRIVEEGTSEEIFLKPVHPYTQALMEAIPTIDGERRSEPAISGELPAVFDVATGCRFRTRCPLARAVCAEVDPDLLVVDGRHMAACHALTWPDRRPGARPSVRGRGDDRATAPMPGATGAGAGRPADGPGVSR